MMLRRVTSIRGGALPARIVDDPVTAKLQDVSQLSNPSGCQAAHDGLVSQPGGRCGFARPVHRGFLCSPVHPSR
jgi:hypothetical protein